MIENICQNGDKQKQCPFEDCLLMMRYGGLCLHNGMKDVVLGRQMISGLFLREIKQKYMLKTSDASQID